MALIVPVSPVPAQFFQVPLGGQNCFVNLYQLDTGLFMDLQVSGAGGVLTPIIYGAKCLNLNLIVRSAYLGFIGDFAWVDNNSPTNPAQGMDPYYTGLGAQFSLVYLSTADLPANLPAGVS
jgi:hypothetical protein